LEQLLVGKENEEQYCEYEKRKDKDVEEKLEEEEEEEEEKKKKKKACHVREVHNIFS
jgi:hypothetical protein